MIPKDQAQRDAIVHATGISHFVEAGAGSGKTALLVERMLTLLIDEGVPLTRLAAITFTVKAAEELVNRLRKALTSVQKTRQFTTPSRAVREFTAPEAQERALQALADLPGAAIETLHSFCLRLIRMYPLELGVPPEVTKADELEAGFASVLRAEGVMSYIDSIITGDATEKDPQVVEAVTELILEGYAPRNIESIVLFMDAHWGELGPTLNAPISAIDPLTREDLEAAKRTMLGWIDAGDPQTVKTDSWCVKKVQPFIDAIDTELKTDATEFTDFPSEHLIGRGTGGAKGKWRVDDVCTLKDELEEIQATFKTKLRSRKVHNVCVLRRLIAELTLDNALKRRRAGKLEYHDMIYLAAELMGNEAALAELQDRFRMIAVDEFQDTDPNQLDIVDALTAHSTRFTVGDPKQSIYRFRRADLDTYLSARQGAEERGELLNLTANFRSDDAIVNTVNSLFATMFEQAPGDVPFEAMEAWRGKPGHVAIVRHQEVEIEEAESEQELEFDDVLAAVRGADVKLSDIAVLVPTQQDALYIQRGLLENGIPARTEGSTKIYADPDVEELISVLRAIADPANGFAEIIALRGLHIGVSDEELAEGHLAFLDSAELSPDHPYERARSLLKELRKESAGRTVAGVVELAVDKLNVFANLARPATVEKSRMVQRVIEDARAFTAATTAGLPSFIRWAEEQAESRDGVGEPVLDDGTSAVRIMTIHASKGREFPVVILAGLTRQPSNRFTIGFEPNERTIEFNFNDAPTPQFEATKEFESDAAEAEAVRQLYVAATRAEHSLVIPLEMSRTSSGSFKVSRGRPFAKALEGSERIQLPHDAIAQPVAREDVPHAVPDIDAIQLLYDARAQHLNTDTLSGKFSATMISHLPDGETGADHALLTELLDKGANEGWLRTADEPYFKANRESRGMTFGTVVHESMEMIALDGSVDDVVETVASINELEPELIEEATAAVNNYLASDVVRAALRGMHERELPIIGAIDGTPIDGVIDLLYQDSTTGEWVIGDYKTDAYCSPKRIRGYFVQLQLYAKLLDRDVSRIELYFLGDSGVEVRSLELNS